jgi:TP901-1 family phage major tail protein
MPTQNEMGGKHLLLKKAKALTYSMSNTSSDVNFSAAHGLAVGDLWRPTAVGAATTLEAGRIYFVKEVVDSDTVKVSETNGGAAIVADAALTTLVSTGFAAIGGIRSKSFSINSETIDLTNEDSDEWKVILDQGGVRSVAVSGSGVYSDTDNMRTLQTDFLANNLIEMAFVEVKANYVWAGYFKVESLEISGDYNAESSLSISAASSGEVTLTDMSA